MRIQGMFKNLLFLFMYLLGLALAGVVEQKQGEIDGTYGLIGLALVFMFWTRLGGYMHWLLFGVCQMIAADKIAEIVGSISDLIPIGGAEALPAK